MDTQLNDAGRAQAKITGRSLRDANFVKAYTSDSSRAVDTARAIVAYHPACELVPDCRIRERNMGSLSGTKAPARRPLPSDVETSESVGNRLLDFWANVIIPLLSPPSVSSDNNGSPNTNAEATLDESVSHHTSSGGSQIPAVLVVSHGATISKLLTQVLLRTYDYKAAYEKHVEWMTRGVLNEIISDLKPLIGPKLVKESHIGASGLSASAAKKAGQSIVEVHRGESYQFAYFLKPAESGDLLIKARDFVAVTAPPNPLDLPEGKSPTPEPTAGRATNKKKRVPKSKSRPKLSAAAKKRKRVEESDEEDAEMSDAWSDLDEELPASDEEGSEAIAPRTAPTRRSTRHKSVPQAHEVDEEMASEHDNNPPDAPDQPTPVVVKSEPDDTATLENLLTINADDEPTSIPVSPSSQNPRPPTDTLVVEEEEEKPKQELQLTYTGYMVPGRCLCVIAEPWPALPTPAQRVSQATKPRSRSPALASSGPSRPLFRPESDDEDERPNAHARHHSLTPEFDSDDDEARLRMFSQMINKVGERRSGVATRGAMDEFEDDALYGDADEEGRGT